MCGSITVCLNLILRLECYCPAGRDADFNYNTQIRERLGIWKRDFLNRALPRCCSGLCSKLWFFLISCRVKWPSSMPEFNFSKKGKKMCMISITADKMPLWHSATLWCRLIRSTFMWNFACTGTLIKKLLAGIVGILQWNQPPLAAAFARHQKGIMICHIIKQICKTQVCNLLRSHQIKCMSHKISPSEIELLPGMMTFHD